jgi:hypothetical protein
MCLLSSCVLKTHEFIIFVFTVKLLFLSHKEMMSFHLYKEIGVPGENHQPAASH